LRPFAAFWEPSAHTGSGEREEPQRPERSSGEGVIDRRERERERLPKKKRGSDEEIKVFFFFPLSASAKRES
jgi:hypothetical protein